MKSLYAWRFDKFGALSERVEIAPDVMINGWIRYMLPPSHTLVEPPPPMQTNRKRWVFLESTDTWLPVSDHRGETWFNWKGEPVTIERLGDPDLWDLTPENKWRGTG